MGSTIRQLWERGAADPVELIRSAARTLSPRVTGEQAYAYERAVTELYGLQLGPGQPATPPTRWEEPARRAQEQAASAHDLSTEFFAFALLATSLRRAASFAELERLLDGSAPSLGEVPLFAHYQAMAEIASAYNPKTAVALAKAAVKTLGEHAGAYHSLAIAILDDAELDLGPVREEALERARTATSHAIRLDPTHPRFRLTRARVNRLMGRLDEARGDVLSSRREDAGADRDPERRRLYEYELLLINAGVELDRRVSGIEKRVEKRVAGVESRAAQLAGFITGVVALTTIGGNLAMTRTDAGSAIAVLVVIAVLVFGGAAVLGVMLARSR